MIIDKTFNQVLENNGYKYIEYGTHPKAKGKVHIIQRITE
jgi:hypothetical protein